MSVPTVTLKDVAQAAGVSISTASRVLDERGSFSTSAAAVRVRAAADELSYRRNTAASSLRRGATGTFGVLVPRLSDTVMALMFEAIERAARTRGHFALVATCGNEPDDEAQATETLLDRNVDAVILATARVDDRLPESLSRRGIPHVLVLRTDRVSPSSLGDDEAGGYLAMRHLLDLGHRDIGLINGPTFTSTGQDRRAGAERALREAGLTLDPELALTTGYGIEHGVAAGRLLLERAHRPTAIFAANDHLAIGVQTAARLLGLVPGQDISIVGYNDIPLVAQLPVPLTSVRTPFDTIAATALDLVTSKSVEREPIRRALPTLIPRASTVRAPL